MVFTFKNRRSSGKHCSQKMFTALGATIKEAFMSKLELIGKLRALTQPTVIAMYRNRLDGVIRHNGRAVSERELATLKERNKVHVFNK